MVAKTKQCKFCKKKLEAEKGIMVNMSFFCNINHASMHGIKLANESKQRRMIKEAKKVLINLRDARKKNAVQKREFKANDIKTRKEAAKKACHAYIRARDKGLPCICCGRVINGVVHAGHFLESGNNSFLRYNEDNIHAQSGYCNTYKGGNSDDYEGRLRVKIGNDRVDYLLANKGGTVKRTSQDYKDIELLYKEKLKEFKL